MAGRAKENLPGGSRYGTSSYMLKSVFLNVVTVYIYILVGGLEHCFFPMIYVDNHPN